MINLPEWLSILIMRYPGLVTLHLFAALVFVGAVFFEVLILHGARKHAHASALREVERAIGLRARCLMPWILLVLYGAGLGLACNTGPC